MGRLRGLRSRYQGRVNKPTVERFDKQGNIIKVTIDYKSLLEQVIKDFDKINKIIINIYLQMKKTES